ncbi:MAG: Anti-sigma factor antagonist [Pseudonocardia sp.]|nr:Anti-sigma factor antagonist [Pseudonocardia sp.]
MIIRRGWLHSPVTDTGEWGSSDLRMTISKDTVRCEVRLRGTLDVTTSHHLRAAPDELIRAGYPEVVLDLAELDFIAATGLEVLIHFHNALQTAGGGLTLTNLPRIVERVLVVTELERLTVE